MLLIYLHFSPIWMMWQTLLHCLDIFFWDCCLCYEPFERSYELSCCLIKHENSNMYNLFSLRILFYTLLVLKNQEIWLEVILSFFSSFILLFGLLLIVLVVVFHIVSCDILCKHNDSLIILFVNCLNFGISVLTRQSRHC